MRKLVRRHLGKVLAGTAIAVTGTAAMIGITLPGTAGADDGPGGRAAARASGQGTQGQGADGQGEGAGAPDPGVVAEAADEGEKGVGRDPLTDDELKRAEQLATAPDARNGRDARGGRGPQHLTTDLAEPDPSDAGLAAPRRAVVSYYDYRTDRLVTSTVDLTTGKVEQSAAQQGVQPSPHREELREAAELILASPLGSGLKADYKDATGSALTSTEPLTLSGYVYRKDREARIPEQLGACGVHRCVRVITKITNGPWIDSRDVVVDLSARKVVGAPTG
ncbi:Tat pathway signal sequence domain protein [Streptomyces sp. NPDC057445]|uniref:Tat pathway signal sequence domain protein n=1 Tax=Streptomyces sp. NPDC057445 TaxID=3346136 RepID=UPI00369EBEF2